MSFLKICHGFIRNCTISRVPNKTCVALCETKRAMSTFYSSKAVPQLDFISKNHQEMYELSLRDPNFFWGQLGASRLDWMSNFHTVRNSNIEAGKHEWFIGGQLNVSGNLLLCSFLAMVLQNKTLSKTNSFTYHFREVY